MHKTLVELACFFVQRVLFAIPAVLIQADFFGCIDFIAHGNVVLVLAHRAYQGE